MLEPAGPAAREIAALWWWTLSLGGVVLAIVLALLALALLRRRSTSAVARTDDANRRVVLLGAALPAVVLAALLALTLPTMSVTHGASHGDLRVEVVGHQWWWEVRYPDHSVMTANELYIPIGASVRVDVASADVIHSFWAPPLHGKIDLVPGHMHHQVVRADRAGRFRAPCAEFCGLQHAFMALEVVAVERRAFDDWLELQRRPARGAAPASTGQQLFVGHCIGCHAIRYGDTPVGGDAGPDLTHFASRRLIAGGAAPNTPAALHSWIADPSSLKPGAKMPPSALSTAEIEALTEYLLTLR